MFRLSLSSAASNRANLAGSAMGRQILAQLIAETKSFVDPTVAFLDFDGIDIATGSFLREAVLGYRDFCRSAMGTLYPVVANINSAIEEELTDYLKERNDAVWTCSLSARHGVRESRLLGRLDVTQSVTLQLVCSHFPVSAPDLARLQPAAGIGPTAWNNRLASLSAKSIIMEVGQGKTKTYSPVLEGF